MNKQAYYIYKAASLTKLALDPIYTEDEFNRKVDEYKRERRGDIPEATTYEDMFNHQLDARQPQIDDVNRRLSKAVWRANGPSPYITGVAGLAGAGAGGLLSNWIFGGWQKPQEKDYASHTDYLDAVQKYKDGFWGRLLGGTALRAGGFLLGGALPYLASRGVEATADGLGAGYRAARGAIAGRTPRGPVSGSPMGGPGGRS